MLKIVRNPNLYGADQAANAFLLDEQFAKQTAAQNISYLHIWRNRQAIVLGQRDLQLANLTEAVANVRQHGWDVLVRQSGGTLVVLDPGVVNLSFHLPNPSSSLDLERDFRWTAKLLSELMSAAAGAQVVIGEVQGAYCPGRYDLSISGKKVCGISQKRYARATLVHAFVNIAGDSLERAQMAAQFYSLARGVQCACFSVELDKTGSLDVLAGITSPETFSQLLVDQSKSYFSTVQVVEDLLPSLIGSNAAASIKVLY